MKPFIQMPTASALWVKKSQYTAEEFERQYNGLSEKEKLAYQARLPKRAAPPQKPQNGPVQPKRQGYGRWEMFNKFIDLAPTELTPAQRVVWMTMFRRADGKDNTLESSIRVLASQTGLTDKTVQRALVKLVKTGWLMYVFKSPSKGTPSRFRMLTKRAEP